MFCFMQSTFFFSLIFNRFLKTVDIFIAFSIAIFLKLR